MDNPEEDQVVETLKAYLKLCAKASNRPTILKDNSFICFLTTLIKDDRIAVVTYLVKILLNLTENTDNAKVLSVIPGFEEDISMAAEKPFPPNVIYNILIVSSRLKTAQNTLAQSRPSSNINNTVFVEKGTDGVINNVPRKFVSRKSKQLIYEFDELWDSLKNDIERHILAKKGVISLYFDPSYNRVTIRTIQSIDANEITDLLFECGCEMVTQIVKVDGVDEYFKMYASEREKKVTKLPEYLDDVDVVDPKSCLVTNDYVAGQKDGGGWFSTISSFVKGSLW